MEQIIEKAKALTNALSDDMDDYPDSSAYRFIQDRVKELNDEIAKYEEGKNK